MKVNISQILRESKETQCTGAMFKNADGICLLSPRSTIQFHKTISEACSFCAAGLICKELYKQHNKMYDPWKVADAMQLGERTIVTLNDELKMSFKEIAAYLGDKELDLDLLTELK